MNQPSKQNGFIVHAVLSLVALILLVWFLFMTPAGKEGLGYLITILKLVWTFILLILTTLIVLLKQAIAALQSFVS